MVISTRSGSARSPKFQILKFAACPKILAFTHPTPTCHAAMPAFSCRGSKSPGPPLTPPFLLCDAGDRDRALFIPSLAPAVIS